MNQHKELDLLLIGKTGNGKSSTGNSILNRKRAFVKSGSSTSVTSNIKEEYSKYKGLIIKAVDSPGIGENRLESTAAVKMVTKALKQAIIMNPRGYNAFLIVLKYGNRFTGEEQATIQFLKKFFGTNFVKDFCILVMAGGDDFLNDAEDEDMTFESWCKKQRGPLEKLLNECGNRIVLFNNNLKEKDIKEKEEQLDKLIYMINHLNADGKRYTDKHFEEASVTRKRIMVEAKEHILQEETKKETSLIIQKLEKVQSSKDELKNHKNLHKLKTRTDKLITKIVSDDKGTGVLHELIDSIKRIKTTIENEIDFNMRLTKEREDNKRKGEEIKRQNKEELERQKKMYEKLLKEQKHEEKKQLEEEMKESERRRENEEKERKEMEEERKKEELKERKRLIKEKEEAESKYKQATDKSNETFLSKALDWVTTPLTALANWVCSWWS